MGKKQDIREVETVAKAYGMDEETRRDFGDYLEECKRQGDRGTKNDRGDFTRDELEQKAREFLGQEWTRSKAKVKIMLGTVDLRSVQEQSSDREMLQAYLEQLVGQPFLGVRFSYGDELSLHLGAPRSHSSPKLKHIAKGSYIIGTRASRWWLHSESSPAVVVGLPDDSSPLPRNLVPLAPQDLEKSDFIKPGSRITFVSVVRMTIPGGGDIGYGLSLFLSDGSSLLIRPEPSDDTDAVGQEVADWEVFTPYDRYLRVGPGACWSYTPSRR